MAQLSKGTSPDSLPASSSHLSQGTVIVQIAGGLGNQLFEYAFGRALALRTGSRLVLDHLSGFPRDFYQRKYTLDRFRIRPDGLFEPSQSFATTVGRVRRRLVRFLQAGRPLTSSRYVAERNGLTFDPQIAGMAIDRRIYFDGYWQHEQYFADAADTLRQELKPSLPHNAANAEMGDRIRSVNAVCLHVRKLHGVPNVANATQLKGDPAEQVDMSYYHRAIAHVRERVPDPHFFVFSDFPQWARENITLDVPITYVTHNGPDTDYEDLWLMSQCRHCIVANSTFSWWGAWLGANPGQIVTAPQNAIGRMLKSVPRSWELL